MITKSRKKRVLKIIKEMLEDDIKDNFFTNSCYNAIDVFDEEIEGSSFSEDLREEVNLFEKRITKMINKFKKNFN